MAEWKSNRVDIATMATRLKIIMSKTENVFKKGHSGIKTVQDVQSAVDFILKVNRAMPGAVPQGVLNIVQKLKMTKGGRALTVTAEELTGKLAGKLKVINKYLGPVTAAVSVVADYKAARSDIDRLAVGGKIMEIGAAFIPIPGVREMIGFYGKFAQSASRVFGKISKGFGRYNRIAITQAEEDNTGFGDLPLYPDVWYGHEWARNFLASGGGVFGMNYVALEKKACKGRP